MHRPVVAAGHRELAGAVERVDDPDPVPGQAGEVVVGLLAEHAVVGVRREHHDPGQLLLVDPAPVDHPLPRSGLGHGGSLADGRWLPPGEPDLA